jgi:tetratricopeptide (TPR) repeat protein
MRTGLSIAAIALGALLAPCPSAEEGAEWFAAPAAAQTAAAAAMAAPGRQAVPSGSPASMGVEDRAGSPGTPASLAAQRAGEGAANHGDIDAGGHAEGAEALVEARRLLDQNRAEEARALLEDYLKTDPQSLVALKLMGRALRGLSRNEEALSTYLQASELAPRDLETLFWIGTLERWLGRWRESLKAFSQALELAPDDVGSLVGGARALMHLGTYDQAERDLRNALRMSPKNAEAASLLAEVLAHQNRLDAARAELEKVFEPAELDKEMADLYREKELYGEAIDRYRAALSLKPDEISYRRSLAEALREDRDFEGALEEYRRLAAENPDDADAHFWVGTLLRWRGADEEAERAYLEALRARPSHAGAMTGLVRVLKKEGRHREALEWAQKAVQVTPNSAEAHTLLGSQLAHEGRGEEAVRELGLALELSPGDREATRELRTVKRTCFQSARASYKLSDARALEGRERGLNAPPYPIPMRYRSDEYVLRYDVPGPGGRLVGAEAGLSYDKLDNLRFDFNVYDVRTLTVKARGAHSLGKAGTLEGSAGVRYFSNVGAGRDLEEKSFFVYDLLWSLRGSRDELAVKTDRDQVLVRGAAENTYFAIVGVTGLSVTHRRALSDYLSYGTSYSLSDYTDDARTHYLSTGPDIYWRRNTFSPRLRYWPLQRYDLDGRDRLQFVRVTSVGSSYRGYFGSAWRATAGYWYSWYDDDQGDSDNAHTWSGQITYHPRWSGPIYIGAETEGTFFALPLGSRHGYISYDSEAYKPVLGIEREWEQGNYRLGFGRSWVKDEIVGWYDSYVLQGYLDAWLGTSTELTFDGRYYRDGLDDFYGRDKEEKVLRLLVGLKHVF